MLLVTGQGQAIQDSETGATHQLQVLGWLFVQVVGQLLVKAGQVLHLHLDPIFPQVVMPLEFISVVVNMTARRSHQPRCPRSTPAPTSLDT